MNTAFQKSIFQVLFFASLVSTNNTVEAAANALQPDDLIDVGESIVSNNGVFTLTLEPTGNLELRYFQDTIWDTGTSGSGATSAVFQTDGNFVLVGGGSQLDATLEAEACGFSDGTIKPHSAASGAQYIDFSSNGRLECSYEGTAGVHDLTFTFKIPGGGTRSMGVFVNGAKAGVIATTSVPWISTTLSGISLVDGSNTIELRDSESSRELDVDKIDFSSAGSGDPLPLWETDTSGQGANRLVMQNDGNLVIYSDTGPLWASGTCCYSPPDPSDDLLFETGLWSSVVDWPLIAIHAVLTPDGKVLT